MSNYGMVGFDITIAVVIRKTVSISGFDEDVAIEEAINQFTITDGDWKTDDLEVENVQPDYIEDWYEND